MRPIRFSPFPLGVPHYCVLLHSEFAKLKCGHIQQRDGRWVFGDLVGKGKRIRTVPIPPFVKVAIDA